MLRFDNDKFAFSEMSLEERESAVGQVCRELGREYAYDSFLAILDEESLRIGDLREMDWEDVEPSDAVYDNAGCALHIAVWDLAALTYVNTDMSWEESIRDVLSQIQ